MFECDQMHFVTLFSILYHVLALFASKNKNSRELKGTHLNSFEPIELKGTQGNCDFISFVLLDTNGRLRQKEKPISVLSNA